MNHPIRILNLGAGVQSTTVALMGVKNWEAWHCSEALPYEPVGLIDFAIFADTQEEPHAVYEHLEWLKVQCEKFFPVLVRTNGNLAKAAITEGTHDIAQGFKRAGQRRFVSAPFFLASKEGINRGMARRHCTQHYKIFVIQDAIKNEILKLPKHQKLDSAEFTQLMGLSYDESSRIISVKAIYPQRDIGFPLFEMEMTRGGCAAWLAKWYPDRKVPRSACVWCPYHSNAEWRNIKENDPPGWRHAVELDRLLREEFFRTNAGLELSPYLHRQCVPLDQADLDDPETKDRKKGQEMFGFLAECEGMCGV